MPVGLLDEGVVAGARESSADTVCDLVLKSAPAHVKLKPGEAVDYSGLSVELGGCDVTSQLSFDFAEGSVWQRGLKRRAVRATYTDDAGVVHAVEFELARRLPVGLIALIAIVSALAVAGVAAAAYFAYLADQAGSHVGQDTGSKLIAQGDMTDEEAQALVNEEMEKSLITVSIASEIELSDDGMLALNFIVPEGNNGLSERVEIEQGGRVVYASGVVEPGYVLETGKSNGASPGAALAIVYAVGEDGRDYGNSVAVDVEIVGAA